MFCKKCGAELKDSAKFCNRCGATISKASPDNAPPIFTPPSENKTKIPTFSPPNDGSIPTFTSPSDIPTFEPPKRGTYERVCYCHTSEPAVTSCACCGKPICNDCADSYRLTGEDFEYSNKPLCYDCASNVFQEDIEIHKANLKEIKTQFIILIIGMIVGGCLLPPVGILIGGCLGTFLWTFAVETIRIIWAAAVGVATGNGGVLGSILGSLFNIAVQFVKAAIQTFTKFIKYIFYLSKVKKYKNISENGLRELTAYYEYTLTLSQNKGVDLSVLMANGTLTNNSFAQAVASVGEEQAMQNISQIKVSFNEFGEIVREFQAA